MTNFRLLRMLDTPLIITPGHEEFDSVEAYWNRMQAAIALIKGEIDQETFEDILNENNVDVIEVFDIWEEGRLVG